MSSVEEHFAILRAMKPLEGGWLTDRFHQSAAIFLGAHLKELEAAWLSAHPPAESGPPGRTGSEAYTAEGKDALDELSLALARQRELETERDEAIATATAWEEQACTYERRANEYFGELEAAETRQRELEEALRPFAATGALLDAKPKDDAVWAGQTPAPPITFGHLRKAALLSPPTRG